MTEKKKKSYLVTFEVDIEHYPEVASSAIYNLYAWYS